MEIKSNNIGICLGGGGALGFAHIGVLKVLENHGISPFHVSGASIGAIIGMIYAQGYSPDQIMQIVVDEKLDKLMNIVSPSSYGIKGVGLSDHRKVEKILQKYVPHNSFDLLKRRFSLSVVEMRSAESRVISSGGNLIEYVLASISIPFAFEPELIDDEVFIDGGMMNNLPVEQLERCDDIIGVDVQTAHYFAGTITRKNILQITYRIMQKQMNAARVAKCNHYMTFPELDTYEITEFGKFKEIYDIGYRGATHYLEAHPELLSVAK